jgi:ABC-type polysaccharide/polyol phosphate export permease
MWAGGEVAPGGTRASLPRAWLDQLIVLTGADLRARYGRGRWQLVKWLVDPFALVGVYLLMVRFIFYRRPPDIGLSLACSIIPFQLIMMTVQGSLESVRSRSSILANMRFARMLLPISTALTEACGFAARLVLLALMMAAYAVAPNAQTPDPPAWELLFPVLWCAALLAIFLPIYAREQRHFAKVLE